MSAKNSKIILNKIPSKIDKEDLAIFFESNIFGFQTVVNISEVLDGDKKDVIVEFENEGAAREVAKKRSVPFEFGDYKMLIKPVLFFDDVEHKQQNQEQAKSFKEELQEELFTCWVGNIPNKNSQEKLEQFFRENTASKNVHSIKLILNPKHNKYQCFVNFFKLVDAEEFCEQFNGAELNGSFLKAYVRCKQNSLNESISDSDSEVDPKEFEQKVQLTDISTKLNQKTFSIRQSKNFSTLIVIKVKEIGEKYPEVTINQKSTRRGNLNFQIMSDNIQKVNECFKELSSNIKILEKKLKFDKNEFDQVSKLKSELIKIKPKKPELFYLNFDDNNKSFIIQFFDSGDKKIVREFYKFSNLVEKYLYEKIDSQIEISLSDLDHFNYCKMLLSKRDDLKLNLNETSLKINLSGKKIVIEKFNLNDFMKKITIFKVESNIGDKRNIPHMNFKLKTFKSELESNNLLLKYDKIEQNSNSYCFSILSTNAKEAKKKAQEIKDYFVNFKTLIVNFSDITSGKKLEKEINNKKIHNCDVYFNEKKKIFFINGTDIEKMNNIKREILTAKQS